MCSWRCWNFPQSTSQCLATQLALCPRLPLPPLGSSVEPNPSVALWPINSVLPPSVCLLICASVQTSVYLYFCCQTRRGKSRSHLTHFQEIRFDWFDLNEIKGPAAPTVSLFYAIFCLAYLLFVTVMVWCETRLADRSSFSTSETLMLTRELIPRTLTVVTEVGVGLVKW